MWCVWERGMKSVFKGPFLLSCWRGRVLARDQLTSLTRGECSKQTTSYMLPGADTTYVTSSASNAVSSVVLPGTSRPMWGDGACVILV